MSADHPVRNAARIRRSFETRTHLLLRSRIIEELRRSLVDVRAISEALGLLEGPRSYRRQPYGLVVRCPWHADREPSCSVQLKTGTLIAHCFACSAGGDVLAFIAAARGYNLRSHFRDVLEEAARIARRFDLLDALRKPGAPTRPAPAPRVAPTLSAPPALPALDNETYDALASALLNACPLRDHADVSTYLNKRGLFADAEARGFGALPPTDAQRPLLASLADRFGHQALTLAGLTKDAPSALRAPAHRLVIPWRDPSGRIIALQRRILGSPQGRIPKYVFPNGRPMPTHPFGAEFARELLAAHPNIDIAWTESALDALAMSALCRRAGCVRLVLGLPSATSWRPEWAVYARGRRVLIATDADAAGDKAAARIVRDLYDAGALSVARCRPTHGKDWGEALEEKIQ